MPIQPPNLDDRRTADLVAEARTLIPRYTPEWTDFNESDPGMTLLELFGWMTDILLYRLNLVPERNYLKFLQLLGIEQKPAQPASADLTFTLSSTVADYISISKGTKVAAGVGVFETQENLIALGATLSEIQSFDGLSYSVLTQKNALAGQSFFPFGPIPRAGNALLLGFDALNALTDQQINLMIYTSSLNLKTDGLHCSTSSTLDPQPAVLIWEYYNGQQWLALRLNDDGTQALTQDGHIYVQGPGSSCQRAQYGQVAQPLYWLRARLVQSSYQTAPNLEAIVTNTVRAIQAVTIRDEALGASNGLPSQQFQLANTPVVVRSTPRLVVEPRNASDGQLLVNTASLPLYLTHGRDVTITVTSVWLQVDEGDGPQTWQEVSDFYASGPDDRHFTLNRTTGVITFGDGIRGCIPRPTQQSNSVLAHEYRYGGGKQGNVAANTITALQDVLKGVESVTNRKAAFGGTDEETLDDAKLRAPQELKNKGRAVTVEDFESIAIATPGAAIRRAKALPLTHPKFPGQKLPGIVTVIVVSESDQSPPTPTPATLSLVCAYLDKHRLLTAEVYVVPPTYHAVRIAATLAVKAAANFTRVQQQVIAALQDYLNPLSGGDDGQGWPFGGTIYFSKLYRVVMEVDGVDYIQDNQFTVYLDGQPYSYKDVALEAGALPYLSDYDIRFLVGGVR